MFSNSNFILSLKFPDCLHTFQTDLPETARSMKPNETNSSQSEKFQDKIYRHFGKSLIPVFKTFLKFTDYLQNFQISGNYQIHQKPMSSLSGKFGGKIQIFLYKL